MRLSFLRHFYAFPLKNCFFELEWCLRYFIILAVKSPYELINFIGLYEAATQYRSRTDKHEGSKAPSNDSAIWYFFFSLFSSSFILTCGRRCSPRDALLKYNGFLKSELMFLIGHLGNQEERSYVLLFWRLPLQIAFPDSDGDVRWWKLCFKLRAPLFILLELRYAVEMLGSRVQNVVEKLSF